MIISLFVAIPAIRCIFFEEKSKKDAASIRAKLTAKVSATPHNHMMRSSKK